MKPTSKPNLLTRVLSQIPLCFSAIALILSFLSFRLTAVRSVKPVLTVSYRGESGWFLENVGTGPALNVVVAVKGDGDWFLPVRVLPLGPGQQLILRWLKETNIKTIGATYADIDGRRYTSLTSEDLTTTKTGGLLPNWPESEIHKEWELEAKGR